MNRYYSAAAGPLTALLVLLALPYPRANAQNFFEALNQSIQEAQRQQQQQQRSGTNQQGTQKKPPSVHKYEYRPGKDDYSYGKESYSQPNSNWQQRQRYQGDDGNYYQPQQQRYARPQQQNTAPKQEPVEAKLVPAKPNPVQLSVRSATKAEIDAVRKELATLQDDMVASLEDALEDTLPKTSQLITQLDAKGVAADTQTQLLTAVKSGNADQAQILWATSMKDSAGAEDLYRRVAVGQALKNLRENAGDLVARDVRNLRRALDKAGLDAKAKKEVAQSVQELEASLSLLDGVGAGGDGAAKIIAPPTGQLEVLANPKLAKGTVVELAPGRYMIAGEGKKLALVHTSLAATAGFAVIEGDALAAAEGREITSGIFLRCSTATKNPVGYRLARTAAVYSEEDDETYNQQQTFDYKMAPGEFQYLPQPEWRVDFHRGGDFGQASYQLKPGTYEFRATPKGWELFNIAEFAVTIDNTLNRRPFQLVYNNEPKTIEAGQSQTFKSAYPPVVRYLRGALSAERVVRLDEGTYLIGLAAGDGAWDLFPSKAKVAANVAEGGAGAFVPAQ